MKKNDLRVGRGAKAMPEERPFDNLLLELCEGSTESSREHFKEFFQRLVGLARSRLNQQMLQKEDPEDIVQSVFKSFFRGVTDGQLEAGNWGDVWSILVVITLRKCYQKSKYYHRARRDVRREVTPRQRDSDSMLAWQAQAATEDPTPDQAVILTEVVESLMRELRPTQRPILVLSLQGSNVTDISNEIGCTERTVQRVLRRVRLRLKEMSSEVSDL